ncbi:MAG: FmdB family zinc ribbon protein [Phycisphaerae bacterium]
MPTYEYQCKECGATFDIFQSIKAAPLRKAQCAQCDGRRPVRRLIGTGGGVIFKGSGFYQTDYRSESYKKAAKAEKEAKGKTVSGKDGTKGDGPKSGDSTPTSSGKPKSDGNSKTSE